MDELEALEKKLLKRRAELSRLELGWQPFFDFQLTEHDDASIIARVCSHQGSHIGFLTLTGEIRVPTSLVEVEDELGDGQSNIAIGDWFLLNREDHRTIRRLERKTVLMRKAAGDTVKPQLIAANLDTVFIVSSCNQDFNLSRLERYLALVLESQATPIVVLTKADLCDDP